MSIWSLVSQQSVFQRYHSENYFKSFTHEMVAEASWHWNYVTVTLCTFCCPNGAVVVACYCRPMQSWEAKLDWLIRQGALRVNELLVDDRMRRPHQCVMSSILQPGRITIHRISGVGLRHRSRAGDIKQSCSPPVRLSVCPMPVALKTVRLARLDH